MTDFYNNPDPNDPLNPQNPSNPQNEIDNLDPTSLIDIQGIEDTYNSEQLSNGVQGIDPYDDYPEIQIPDFGQRRDKPSGDFDVQQSAGYSDYDREPYSEKKTGHDRESTSRKKSDRDKKSRSDKKSDRRKDSRVEKKSKRDKRADKSGNGKEEKKTRGTGFKVFLIILKTFITVALMILVGFASYWATLKYYEVTNDNEKPKKSNPILDVVSEATADDVSRNIIYSVDEDKNRIRAIVIEILNTTSGNLDYITIPVESEFNLSNDLFRRLYAAEVDIPQTVTLSRLTKYIKDETAYEYGMLILEEHFGIDLGYYTEMSTDVFDSIFTFSEDTGYYKLSDSILSKASSLTEKDAMEDFIKEESELFSSNIKIKSKLKYAEPYLAINPEFIYYYVIPGEEKNGVFYPDTKKTSKLYESVLLDMTHKTKQEEVKVISSEDKNIKVLNGSGGEGIAGRVKGILATEGFKVGKIADNPEIVPKTIIYVKKEGMGKDLLPYFDGAIIEKGVPDKDFDIVIVVGSADKEIQAPEESE